MLTKEGIRLLAIATISSSVIGVLVGVAVVFALIIPVVGPTITLILGMILDVLIIFALIGIFGVQYPQIGKLGALGFSLALVGAVISIPYSLPGNILLSLGLCLLAITSTVKGRLSSTGLWLWLLGVLIGVTGGLLNPLVLLPIAMLLAATGRAIIGLEMVNISQKSDDAFVPVA